MSRHIALTAAALLMLFCSPSPTGHAGGGSERPNAPAFTGIVAGQHGGGLPDADVTLYRITEDTLEGYSWEIADALQSGDDGGFVFESLAHGYYSLVAAQGSLGLFAGYMTLAEDSVRSLDTLFLDGPYTISGTLNDSAGLPVSGVDLKLVGTPYGCRIDTGGDGSFIFSSVAAGDYKMEIERWAGPHVDAADSGGYISLDGVSSGMPSDTMYESYYANLPSKGQTAVDSVTINAGSIEVAGDDYSIIYTIQSADN